MDRQHPKFEETYEYNSTVVVTTLKKGEEEYCFNSEEKVFLNYKGDMLPIIPGIYEPRRGGKVTVSGEYPDGSWTLDCDDIVRFVDDKIIDRTAVYEILREIGINPSHFDAETILEVMRIWPSDAAITEEWTPEDYLSKLLERMGDYLKSYHGSWNGASSWGTEQRQLFSILFGFEVAKFVEKAVDNPNSFNMFAAIAHEGHHRYIELYINGVTITEFMQKHGIELRGRSFFSPGVSAEYLEQHYKEKEEWWKTPYHKAWHEKEEKDAKKRAAMDAEYIQYCKDRGLDPGPAYTNNNSSSGLSMLLGAANASGQEVK